MSLAILEDDKLLYKKEEEILVDMASKIIPEIELSFNNVSFSSISIHKHLSFFLFYCVFSVENHDD